MPSKVGRFSSISSSSKSSHIPNYHYHSPVTPLIVQYTSILYTFFFCPYVVFSISNLCSHFYVNYIGQGELGLLNPDCSLAYYTIILRTTSVPHIPVGCTTEYHRRYLGFLTPSPLHPGCPDCVEQAPNGGPLTGSLRPWPPLVQPVMAITLCGQIHPTSTKVPR